MKTSNDEFIIEHMSMKSLRILRLRSGQAQVKQSRRIFWIAARLTGVRDDLLKNNSSYLFVFD